MNKAYYEGYWRQIMALYGKKTLRTIQQFVDGKVKEFQIGNVSGSRDVTFGRLPEPYRHQLTVLSDALIIDRVFYSWQTPIAWRTVSGMWVIPNVYYSQSTSSHQSVIRVAVDNPGFYDR